MIYLCTRKSALQYLAVLSVIWKVRPSRMKSNFMLKCIHVLQDPRILQNLLMEKYPSLFNDEKYLKNRYAKIFGKELNLVHPTTFNEKLNWLKLNDRNPLYTTLADKYKVKKYVADLIGEKYVVPCYGHWKTLDDIDFSALPDRCFLKMNHDSQKGVLIDKSAGIDRQLLRREFSSKRRKRNWYWPSREWAYKNIEPCILAEQYLEDGKTGDLQDYKFWCFNGKPVYMYVTNKGAVIKENFYDMNFFPVNINHGFPRQSPEFEKPTGFELMKQLAAKLSAHIPFVRIDFFEILGKVYFGEFTFYDWGGLQPFADEETDRRLGELLDLSSFKNTDGGK